VPLSNFIRVAKFSSSVASILDILCAISGSTFAFSVEGEYANKTLMFIVYPKPYYIFYIMWFVCLLLPSTVWEWR